MSYDKEYYKKYRENNKEKLALKNKEWRRNNPDKVKKAHRKQQESGYSYLYQKKYRTTLECKYSSLKGRAKQRNIPFDLNKDIFIKWLKGIYHCIYCGIKVTRGISGSRKRWQTIDRIDNKKGYFIGNIVCSCYRCNLIKSDSIPFFAMKEIGKVLEKVRNEGKI